MYLHAGIRTGARTLNIKGDSFDPAILPEAFSHLSPAEIEDRLCIYKYRDQLKGNNIRINSRTTREGVVAAPLALVAGRRRRFL
jgi:hypothetical protein